MPAGTAAVLAMPTFPPSGAPYHGLELLASAASSVHPPASGLLTALSQPSSLLGPGTYIQPSSIPPSQVGQADTRPGLCGDVRAGDGHRHHTATREVGTTPTNHYDDLPVGRTFCADGSNTGHPLPRQGPRVFQLPGDHHPGQAQL